MRENLTGQKFGRLMVLSVAPDVECGIKKTPRPAWFCRCDCGKEIIVTSQSVKRAKDYVRSCGCARRKHGETSQARTVEFSTWIGLIQRCENPKTRYWSKYGGRGIKVCERWRTSVVNFLEDMGRRPSRKHSLERVDRNGNYCKENCIWATAEIQQNNKENNHWIEFEGKRMTCAQWDRHKSLPAGKVASRISSGWTVEDAITTPNMIHMYRPKCTF